jgi:endoglucanase
MWRVAVVQGVSAMSPGINLGNTLEAVASGSYPFTTSQETYWGNPAANQAIFNGYAAAGFKSVRIPVAWSEYADANNNIAPFWLARVKQVVDYARNAGLYVIINIHWDGGWLIPDTAHQTAVTDKQKKFWTQIANEFASYDNHVLFAGSNEPSMPNTFTPPTQENCSVQKGYNQAFVDAVRATGGNNGSRTLIFQVYSTNIDDIAVCNEGVLPTDTVANRLIAEIHWYSPFDFTINSGDTSHWQFGAFATDPSAVETWGNEGYTRQEFDTAMTAFINKGVPVIMGEYGAYPKDSGPGQGNETYTNYWAQYSTYAAVTRGIVPMWWDTGAILDRNTGAVKDSGLLNAITNGMTTNPEPPGSIGNATND